jgi:hypothetical protein
MVDLKEIFGNPFPFLNSSGINFRGTIPQVPKNPEKIEYGDGLTFIAKELLEEVLTMYAEGICVYDICEWVKLSEKEVNLILDRYAPGF